MRIVINPPREQWDDILKRPEASGKSVMQETEALLGGLRERGWEEVLALTERFDGYRPLPAEVSDDEIKASLDRIAPALRDAIAVAAANIEKFHRAQVRTPLQVDVLPGISCYQKWIPIDRVGLYIPGGTAPLFSTVLMLAIPARIAGCRDIVLCTPGDRNGAVHPAVLYAASWCGIQKVYRLGGVQAIASMAWGLGPVPAVDKLFGPGNAWVTAAKQLVSRDGVAIDMPAGPSEVLVVADDSANPAFVAADLLSQAEHGSDSQVLLLTTSWELAEQVHDETERQVHHLPRRETAEKTLANSRIVVLHDEDAVMEMVDRYAPEHLILATANSSDLAARVRNAGSVFIGHHTPESAGDYASGTNHTLPTSGYARSYSGLSVDSFMKSVTFQELSPEGLRSIQPAISAMARAEGLLAHARAAEIRLEQSGGEHAPETGEEDPGLIHNLLDYLNPLNLLKPLDILDPESEYNPMNLLGRLVPEDSGSALNGSDPTLPARDNIRNLIPYSSARDEYQGQDAIFLDANENPNPNGMNRYPDPRQKELRDLVARIKGLGSERVFTGNGSDEAIDLLIRIFCEPRQSRIITMDPTYGMYAVCANIQDAAVDRVLLNPDFTLDLRAIMQTVRFDTKIIFICSPNNPTGNLVPLSEIAWLASRFRGIVVVDEAYVDFTDGASAINLLNALPNLVVLQTFSKAWGMAGVRLGMAFADPRIIGLMDRVKYPYNVNVLSAATVREAIRKLAESTATGGKPGKPGMVSPDVRLIVTERIRLSERLRELPGVLKVHHSDANFILVKFGDPEGTYRHLRDHGVIVRDRSKQPLCEGCLRITVGTPEENDQLITLLS